MVLPKNFNIIVTVADDGVYDAFGLQVTANQMKRTTIISLMLALLIYTIFYLLYMHNPEGNILPKFCLKYFKQAPFYLLHIIASSKVLHIKDVDLYREEKGEVEVESIERTHL